MAGPRLKVFATRIGFHDAVVAAANQKAALAAWDVRENLFAQGAAAPTDDPAAVQAALAHPGVVLRRTAGSNDPYVEAPEPGPPPTVASKPRAGSSKTQTKAPSPPPPDRSALDRAERAIADFERESTQALDDLARQRRELDARELELRRSTDERRKALERARDEAHRDYVRSGGR